MKGAEFIEFKNEGLAANSSDYIIVDCIDNGGIICQQTSGYVVNDDKIYRFVGENGGEIVTSSVVSTSSDCTGTGVGKFIKTKEILCVSTGATGVGIELGGPAQGQIIVKGTMPEGSPFSDSTSKIKHGKKYIIKDKFSNTNEGN